MTITEVLAEKLNRDCVGFQRGWGSNPIDNAKLEALGWALDWLRQPEQEAAILTHLRAVAADEGAFLGSGPLMTALYETYEQHIGIAEPDGPDGPYMWCACGWRSDDLGPNDSPGASYAVHLVNAQHAAAKAALQPRFLDLDHLDHGRAGDVGEGERP